MLSLQDLSELDRAVERMLLTGESGEVRMLGAGEIACVLDWRGRACKRLPPFDDAARAEGYAALVRRYLELLRAAGVRCVETEVQSCARADGRVSAYVVQPRLGASSLLPARLLRAAPDEALELFRQIVRHVHDFVTPRAGLDAQLSNWAVGGGRVVLLDVTTPLLRDERGRELLDTELFVAVLPAAVRGLVRRFYAKSLLDRFFHPRGVLLDLLGNAPNSGLARFREPFLAEANRSLDPPLTMREVRAYHLQEKATWAVLRRCLALEQFWLRRVRRSPHPVLLPSEFRPRR